MSITLIYSREIAALQKTVAMMIIYVNKWVVKYFKINKLKSK